MNNILITSFLDSGIIGQIIIVLLTAFSVYLWTLVQVKFVYFRRMKKADSLFLSELSEKKGNILNFEFDEESFADSPLFRIFSLSAESLREAVMDKNRISAEDIASVESLVQKTISQERLAMEESNYILASMASVSTLLGLLGTVTGIMSSFKSMGSMGTASITAIAPGVAEALVTTVMGLVVAIPAAVLYNYVTTSIRSETVIMNNFAIDLMEQIDRLASLTSESRCS